MPSPSKPKRQRVDLTWDEKRTICEVQNEKPTLTHSELAKYMVDHHGFRLVNRSTISKILEESDRWLEVSPNVREGKTRRVRDAKWPQVDKALMLWVGQIRARRGGISDAMLVEKATEFRDAFGISKTDFKLSHGWLEKFKSRHGVSCQNLHGELVEVDTLGGGAAHAKLLEIVATYDPEDVFNFDETGLYYRAPPSVTLNGGGPMGMREKDRVTLGFCVNISGKERLKMIFIHHTARPKCFPDAFDPNLFVHYYSNSNAWMNADVFTHWVTGENRRMAERERKILILLDNAASHNIEGMQKTQIGEFDALVLSNVTLLFFPANVTLVVQPLDQGVFAALKLRYKRKLVAWTLSQCVSSAQCVAAETVLELDLLQCLIWLVSTWNDLDAEIVRNAWRVADIFPRDWIADIISLEERAKVRMDEEVAELDKLIAALDLGHTGSGDPIERLAVSDYISMVDEANVEAEYSTQQIADLVGNCQMLADSLTTKIEDELDVSIDKNDTEPVPIDLVEARVCGQKLLDFMLGEGSESFTCSELLQMERICDKLSRMGVAPVTATQLSVIKSFVLGE